MSAELPGKTGLKAHAAHKAWVPTSEVAVQFGGEAASTWAALTASARLARAESGVAAEVGGCRRIGWTPPRFLLICVAPYGHDEEEGHRMVQLPGEMVDEIVARHARGEYEVAL